MVRERERERENEEAEMRCEGTGLKIGKKRINYRKKILNMVREKGRGIENRKLRRKGLLYFRS